MTQFYLDNNATTPLRPAALHTIQNIFGMESGALNPSSVHFYGQKARKIIDSARDKVANLLNAQSAQVIFNSGATEGNNTVIRYFKEQFPNESILVSATEHLSVLEAAKGLEIIPVNLHGLLDLEKLEERLQQTPKVSLVCVMLVNNESGVIQDIAAISKIVHRYGALLHTDGVQGAGRINIDIREMGIDFLTLSAHKIGGAQGVGALIMGSCGITPVLLHGGGQEKFARAGSHNVAGIAAFGAAAQECIDTMAHNQILENWRNAMEARLLEISPDIIIHGAHAPRVGNTSFFSAPNKNAQSLLIALDLEGIAISNGSACSSGSVKPSHVLKAMGAHENITAGALRVSLGWATKEDDVQAFLKAWEKIYSRNKH